MTAGIQNGKGSILITTLWIMAILSLLAMGIGFRASLEVRLSKYSMDKLGARYLAKAGIVKAREYLSNDTNAYDTLYECGISLGAEETPENVFGAEFNEVKFNEWPVGTFSVHVRDEERKINLNVNIATNNNRAEFKRIMKGLSSNLTDEIINAVIDWQDGDSDGEAEDTYYSSLEHPYNCKNASFELVEELLLVKGVSRDLFDEIKDYVTVYSDGKINVNTASGKVLNAVIDNDALINDIIAFRKGTDGVEGTNDDGKFTDINAFLNFPEDNASRMRLTSLNNYFTVTSNNFRITSFGNLRRITEEITCVVERGEEKIRHHHEK